MNVAVALFNDKRLLCEQFFVVEDLVDNIHNSNILVIQSQPQYSRGFHAPRIKSLNDN